MEAAQVIKLLLNVLPDSGRSIDFDWCWNELGDKAQELVKQARSTALEWLRQNEVQSGQSHD